MKEVLFADVAKAEGSILPKNFYFRRTDTVAEELLGKVIVRKLKNTVLSGVIVEVEAYFGVEDPASRARRGGDLRRTLYGDVGLALVYGIHRQWMLNVVAHEEGEGGAVLFRAIEPVQGIETMMALRDVDSVKKLASGPGRLTKALGIDKGFHKKPLYRKNYGLWIEDRGVKIDKSLICRDWRIGVKEDLPKPYRYFISDSPYISKKGSSC